MTAPFCVLAVAGSDSGGGAGIQSDQRTILALGGHALTAVTAVTAQDTVGISAWAPVPAALLRAQLESALGGFPVAAAKTGLLPGAAAVRTVAAALARHPALPVVVDPVLASSSGTRFLPAAGVAALRRLLFPRAALVTPNWPEAELLTGRPVHSPATARAAARQLAAECGRPVLVKGGHARRGPCRDCLALPDGTIHWFEVALVATANTHGTGCVLSAAIAAWLARGAGLLQAVRSGQSFLHRGLERGRGLSWGRGRGPAFVGPR